MKSDIKQKILLLLVAGVTLGLSRTPKNYFKILKDIPKEWEEIERNKLIRVVREFYNNRIISYKENEDGVAEIVLTKNGRQRALKYQVDEIKIKKPARWDNKWRVVIFDIPERKRRAREAIRDKLRELGFLELQKSVFIFPYECEDEIDFIVEIFEIRRYVRFIKVDSFTNEEEFKIKFGLY